MKHDPLTADGAQVVADYTPVQLAARVNGWTAHRQRVFLTALAETGSVTVACTAAGITARSAYRLRADPRGAAFAAAWHRAIYVATHALVALAFERATKGTYRETWKNGELVAETRQPSDTMLKFLLTRLMPSMFAAKAQDNWDSAHYAQHHLPGLLDKLADCDVPADRLSASNFDAEPRNREIEPPIRPGSEEDSWLEDVAYDPGQRGGAQPVAGARNDGPDCYPPRSIEDRAKDYLLPGTDEEEAPDDDLDDEDFDDEDFDDDDFEDEDDLDEDEDEDEEADEDEDDSEISGLPWPN